MKDDKEEPHQAGGRYDEPSSWLSKMTSNLFGPKTLRDVLECINVACRNEAIDNQTGAMIGGVINVASLHVRDIMIPRPQMITVSTSMPLETVLEVAISCCHTRLPVFHSYDEEVCGILHTKDLLALIKSENREGFTLESVLRPVTFIPESKKLDSLLKDFKQSQNHLAVVVDEYGSISGLVTIEDILEEIVGEIEDEFDQEEEHIRKTADNEYVVEALTEIEEFNEAFNTRFSNTYVDTIGGFIVQHLERLPEKGETVVIDKFSFTVLAADNRRIEKLQVVVQE